MIRIRDIHINIDTDGKDALYKAAAKALSVPVKEITSLKVSRRSIDARKKNAIILIYTLDVTLRGNEKAVLSKIRSDKITSIEPLTYDIPSLVYDEGNRPVIVGFGPAGMFASLVLAEAGLRPIVFERGSRIDIRTAKVASFWNGGKLDPECNVQFGEGGAGSFSDGKLNSGISDARVSWVLHKFHEYGADESVTYDALPHVGTDRLVEVVANLRNRVISLGGEIFFDSRMTGILENDGHIRGITVEHEGASRDILSNHVILALGHSARDTFTYLIDKGIEAQPKPFSMGVRIEHKQAMVDRSQYGEFGGNKTLGPAPYKLNCKTSSGSAYTFCMCPGGYVVAAASEPGRVVTNGMSYFDRAGENANSALLVTITPEMFPERDVLSGMRWQQQIEKKAFLTGGGNYHAPAQRVGDFMEGKASEGFGTVQPTYRPGVTPCDLREVLPDVITTVIREALPALDRRLKGFCDGDAVMTAPETRSSSPIRIIRDVETLQSVSVAGLWPCGEGAGYAGGIVSAAVDGMRCAEKIIQDLS